MFKLNPVLRAFWDTPSRIKGLFGGRASSKSHDAAGRAIMLASHYKLKFCCARQFQNRIEDSVYTLLKNKIYESPWLRDFEILKNSIRNKKTGSEFLFYGIARNLMEIKSMEGIDVLWLEEVHAITEEQWDILYPTIRKEGSEIWCIWNPNEETDFIWQHLILNPPEDCITMQINWDQNPFLSDTMLKTIRDEARRDRKKFDHIYGGIPKTGNDKSYIRREYVLAAIDAHKQFDEWEVEGSKRTGYDVADDGDDKNAICDMHGNVIVGIEEWEGLEDQLLVSAKKVYNHAREFGSSVTYDCIGVGAGIGSKFKELNDAQEPVPDAVGRFLMPAYELEYDAFNAGGKVDDPDGVFMHLPHADILNKDKFSNIKAQKWEEVADKFRKTYERVVFGIEHPFDELISIDSDFIDKKTLQRLTIELSQPRRDYDMSGRDKVESKKDMLKREVKSPNMADAVIMAALIPVRDSAGFFD